MKLLCDKEANDNVIEKLGIKCTIEKTIKLQGYKCIHHDNSLFYVEESEGRDEEFLVADIADENVWELDKFQNAIGLSKKLIAVEGDRIVKTEKTDLYTYFRRIDDTELENCTDVDSIRQYRDKSLQLSVCDLYLLIPGKIDKKEGIWDEIPEIKSSFFEAFRDNIDRCVKEEYNSEFVQNVERKCIGEVVLQINDSIDGLTYRQKALIGVVKHETGFCIIEIIVPNCSIGGNKLLNYYCGSMLRLEYQGEQYDLSPFCEKLQIRCFGKKRSIAFVYNDASKEEIINALANEENPMGKIGGDFSRKVEMENIAQYDTAEVYVSHETMLEKCKKMSLMGEDRLAYQAIEIFFVELILFQDAAVDKVYQDLNQEEERQQDYRAVQDAIEKYEQLSFDMAKAIRFGDYEQFNFPTVRESAKRVAQNFGVDSIFEKYKTNKELLGAMISANTRRVQEQQDNVKNKFLLLLSSLATVGTFGEILYVIYGDSMGGMLCYGAALLVVAGIYGLYKLITRWTHKSFSGKRGK